MYYVDEHIKNTNRVFPQQGRYDYLRYDMNENPEGLPKKFVDSVLKEITPEFLSIYPEPDRFLNKYAAYIGASYENVVAVNGSDMGIRYLLETFGEKGKDVVTVAPSFEMYWVNCSILGLHHVPVAYEPDMTISIDKILDAITENTRIVVLLNPSDVDNSYNDKEAMDYFNSLYSMADVAIVHGLRKIRKPLFYDYKQFYSLNTILRREILKLKNIPSKDIYCILGGGTVNVSCQFTESSIRIGELCIKVAEELSEYRMHIVCSSANIYDALYRMSITDNVFLYKDIISPQYYYAHASLIITRSGRNTLSEIKYLDIPAITFVTGDRYRVVEQRQNVNLLHDDCCLMAESNWTKDELVRLIKRLNIPKESDKIGSFIPGNAIAMEILLNNTSSMPTK